MKSEIFIKQLIDQSFLILDKTEKLKSFDDDTLTWRSQSNSWNILECIEHLNLYAAHYIPTIKWEITSSQTQASAHFQPGLLGYYFAKSMLPKQKLNKMKTFKSKNPIHHNLSREVIDVFIQQQNELINLLMQSRYVNINLIKIKTSISPLLRFNLGDTFHFYINHIIRHQHQIDNILTNYQLENIKPLELNLH